ncbi:5'-nucleotidase [Bacteroides heparinolyticus]|uniref:5'-nucleotidase-like protein n=2 Tax=Prevotella heparinolytica TaxID=28113 RepID=A0A2R3MV74_9BACE|nr:5'-nucleotidase [Bacteroides heparinolyticus]AVM58794.1 5'-nucleotidase [Bacteroides heparinolyticus]TCO91249.1 5'-nucleotidase-like protein [Bacteroides heparinolyticus]
MKKQIFRFLSGGIMTVALLLASCHSSYKVARMEGGRIPVDSTWDVEPDAEAMALLAPYKQQIDSVMGRVIGSAEVSMDRFRPESPLSNLIADVLREVAMEVQGAPADMGLINMGGIRNSLSEGPITIENIFEVLPFENSLCVLTMKGTAMKLLFDNIAVRGGEGVSGIELEITKEGKVLRALVGGKPVEDDRTYTVATVDYLADGNDGLTAFMQADKRVCPQGATVRDIFTKYVERHAAAGKKITSRMEGRVIIKE